jgi:hypothetical protein
VRFSLIESPAKANIIVSLTDATTLGQICGKELVCKKESKIVISAAAWQSAPGHFANLGDYRAWLVNYGFGLAQSQKPKTCPGKGKTAPVMQRQWSDLAGCRANAWVYG